MTVKDVPEHVKERAKIHVIILVLIHVKTHVKANANTLVIHPEALLKMDQIIIPVINIKQLQLETVHPLYLSITKKVEKPQ